MNLLVLNWFVTVVGVLSLTAWGLSLGAAAIFEAFLHLITHFKLSRIILYLLVLSAFMVLLTHRIQTL